MRVLALDSQGRCLLVKMSYARQWYLPGGGIDAGETAREAALRELIEETGYSARKMDFAGFYFNRTHGRSDHVALFLATDLEKLHEFKPTLEILEVQWTERTQLPQDTSPATRRRIEESLRGELGAKFSEGEW